MKVGSRKEGWKTVEERKIGRVYRKGRIKEITRKEVGKKTEKWNDKRKYKNGRMK